MSQNELLEQIHRLKAELEDAEFRLRQNDIPLLVLEDFKSAIDHIRLTVWGILQASGTARYEAAATIIRFRMRRADDICQQIISNIDAQDITVESPELKKLHETLTATVNRIHQLYRSGS